MASERTPEEWAEWFGYFTAEAVEAYHPDKEEAVALIRLLAKPVTGPNEPIVDVDGDCPWCLAHLDGGSAHAKDCPVRIAKAIIETQT